MSTDQPDLPGIGERIEQLLDELRSSVDERTWAGVEELVRLLTELYGAGLVLATEIGGVPVVEGLARDELGSSLLLLHGLHPQDLRGRVQRAVDVLAPGIRKGGGDVRLEHVVDGDVRVVLTTSGSHAEALRQRVLQAVWGAAADARAVEVHVVDGGTPVRLGPTRSVATAGSS